MASTRAISRALQAPLRHIAVLAGYEGAAAEEMPEEPEPKPKPDHASPADTDQLEEIAALMRSLEQIDPEENWKNIARGIAGGPPDSPLTRGQAETVIERLRERLARYDS